MTVFKTLGWGCALVCLAAGASLAADKKPARPASKPDLVGHWVSPTCETRDGANGQKNHLKRDFSYTKTEGRIDLVFFEDAECTRKAMTLHLEGPYSLGKASAKAAGATEGDFSFTRAVFTPHNAFFVELFNKGGAGQCGTQTWKADLSQDVTATGCSPMGYAIAHCPTEYDVVKVEGGQLFFGARPEDGSAPCSADKRPTRFQVPLTRAK